jgi:hypothetical protein
LASRSPAPSNKPVEVRETFLAGGILRAAACEGEADRDDGHGMVLDQPGLDALWRRYFWIFTAARAAASAGNVSSDGKKQRGGDAKLGTDSARSWCPDFNPSLPLQAKGIRQQSAAGSDISSPRPAPLSR